jgi:hypothetical protein
MSSEEVVVLPPPHSIVKLSVFYWCLMSGAETGDRNYSQARQLRPREWVAFAQCGRRARRAGWQREHEQSAVFTTVVCTHDQYIYISYINLVNRSYLKTIYSNYKR